ncbi:MAG: hypothetical protein COB49_07825 [Alphaproteobacteria bacterium]|nr:MAG: hypothetical protein COB49_07825 [Alphaproteobacteria bacterium]
MKRVREWFFEFKEEQDNSRKNTAKLRFKGVGDHDVYNITAPFISANKVIIAGRVEPRDQEKSNIVFFEEFDNIWFPIPESPVFELQDPFITFIRDELIFGGVKIRQVEGALEWRTVFFRGPDIFNLVEFFHGPAGMKDIRLCDLENGKIAVFTRPQGEIGGRGTIGYVEVNNLEDMTIDVIESADLLDDMFHPMDWGGVNEAHLLDNGDIGVLAHGACYRNDHVMNERHYYAKSFIFNPSLRQIKDYKIIASRDQFEDGPAKRKDIADVVFSSGLIRHNGMAILYAGVSDAEAHWIEIDDPFHMSKN